MLIISVFLNSDSVSAVRANPIAKPRFPPGRFHVRSILQDLHRQNRTDRAAGREPMSSLDIDDLGKRYLPGKQRKTRLPRHAPSKPGFPIWLWYRFCWTSSRALIFGGSTRGNPDGG